MRTLKLFVVTVLTFGVTIAALHAAEPVPVVVVQSASAVSVDGVDQGKPLDAIRNHPELAPAIQAALEAWAAEITRERTEATAALAAKTERIQTVLQRMLTEELKTGNGPRAQVLRELLAEAAKPEAQLKREALQAEIQAKQAELARLTPP